MRSLPGAATARCKAPLFVLHHVWDDAAISQAAFGNFVIHHSERVLYHWHFDTNAKTPLRRWFTSGDLSWV
jgi:hypothetical protein